VVFLAHYVGGGIQDILELYEDDFFDFLEAAIEFYQKEAERPIRVILSGIEKGK